MFKVDPLMYKKGHPLGMARGEDPPKITRRERRLTLPKN